jgi:hypothetical protein
VSWPEVTIIAVALLGASVLQSSIGFGMGMLAAPIIGVIDPSLLPGTIVLLAVLVTAVGTWKERRDLDLRGAGWALTGRIPGSLLGAWLVAILSPDALAWVVAAVVLAGVCMAFVGWAPHPGRRNLMVAGLASGVMGTSTSIGGAPMALIWQGSHGPRLRGTMSAFFLIGSLISAGALIVVGAVTPQTYQLVVWMIPVVLLGYLLSRFINRVLDRRRLRLTALIASAGGAALLIGALIF